jgi:hypothetical protein
LSELADAGQAAGQVKATERAKVSVEPSGSPAPPAGEQPESAFKVW